MKLRDRLREMYLGDVEAEAERRERRQRGEGELVMVDARTGQDVILRLAFDPTLPSDAGPDLIAKKSPSTPQRVRTPGRLHKARPIAPPVEPNREPKGDVALPRMGSTGADAPLPFGAWTSQKSSEGQSVTHDLQDRIF
jgi:hypothetical protein